MHYELIVIFAVVFFVVGYVLGKVKKSGETVSLKPPSTAGAGQGIPTADTANKVQELLKNGRKIEAIKALRDGTGLGLKEAKDIVDSLERGESVPMLLVTSSDSKQLPGVEQINKSGEFADVRSLVLAGKKIEAVKQYRAQTGLGLKEAKDAIDQLSRELGV